MEGAEGGGVSAAEQEGATSGGPRGGGSTEDQHAESPKQSKSRSGPDVLSLSPCAACYNQKGRYTSRWGRDGESSSSAEDSGPEAESEAESESSSSSSSCAAAETPERTSPVGGGDVEEEPGGGRRGGAGGRGGGGGDGAKTTGRTRRAPLVKSFSLPASLKPRLAPLSLLPRPPTVVSTLHLQVALQECDEETFYPIRRRRLVKRRNQTKRGIGGTDRPPPPQPSWWQPTRLPWQQGSPHHHPQQQQHPAPPPPHCFLPPQGQRSPHLLPASPHPTPRAYPHPLTPCCSCCRGNTPYACWTL